MYKRQFLKIKINRLNVADGVMDKVNQAVDVHLSNPQILKGVKFGIKGSILAALKNLRSKLGTEAEEYLPIIQSYLLGKDKPTPVYYKGKAMPGLVAIGHGDFKIIISLHENMATCWNALDTESPFFEVVKSHLPNVEKASLRKEDVLATTRSQRGRSAITTPNPNIKFDLDENEDFVSAIHLANINKIKSDLGGVIYTSEEARTRSNREGVKALVNAADLLLMLGTSGASAPFQFWLGLSTSISASLTEIAIDKQIANDADRSEDRLNAEKSVKMGYISLGINLAIPILTKIKTAKTADELFDVIDNLAEGATSSTIRPQWRVTDVDFAGQTPNSFGVYRGSGGANYIKHGNDYYKVKFDADNNTYRLVNPEQSFTSGYHRPIRRDADNQWVFHSDVGGRGGGRGMTVDNAAKPPEGLRGIPHGTLRGPRIPSSLGKQLIGTDNPLAKPRYDLTETGIWPGARGALDLNVEDAVKINISSGSSTGVCWDYTIDILRESRFVDPSKAEALSVGFKNAAAQRNGATGSVDHLITARTISTADELRQVKEGEVLVFVQIDPNVSSNVGARPIHVMVSFGNGKFSGMNNQPVKGASANGKHIYTAEELGSFNADGFVPAKLAEPGSPKMTILAGPVASEFAAKPEPIQT
ncbi:hypothetical protein FA293_31820 [Pseudomonas aeruginosa]|nr:hypothetical protein [Pseudomonas aeruginosa]